MEDSESPREEHKNNGPFAGSFKPLDVRSLSTFDWKWTPGESVDENYLDLAYLMARNSVCKEGSMGCVVTQGTDIGGGSAVPQDEAGSGARIILNAINSPIFGGRTSDCHAEANAVSYCARHGIKLEGSTFYITRPPCLTCYKLLVCAGVRRCVSYHATTAQRILLNAKRNNMELVMVPDTERRKERRDALGKAGTDMDRVRELRKERKRSRQQSAGGREKMDQRRRDDEAAATAAPAPAAAAVVVDADLQSSCIAMRTEQQYEANHAVAKSDAKT